MIKIITKFFIIFISMSTILTVGLRNFNDKIVPHQSELPRKSSASRNNSAQLDKNSPTLRQQCKNMLQSGALEAFSWADSLENIYDREYSLAQLMILVEDLEAEECAKVIPLMKPYDSKNIHFERLRVLLLKKWSSVNPEDALGWIFQNNFPETVTIGVLPEAISALYRKDPDGALNFIKNIPQGYVYNSSYLALSMEMAKKDIKGAFDFANSFPDDKNFRLHCLQAVAQAAAEENLGKTMEEFDKMENSELKNVIGISLAKEISSRDLKEGLLFSEKLSGDAKKEALEVACQAWANNDPVEMSIHVMNMKANEDQQIALTSLCENWSRYDPESAMKWYSNIANELKQDNVEGLTGAVFAGSHLVSNLCEVDQSKGLKMLVEIEDGYLKDGIINNLLLNEVIHDDLLAFNTSFSIVSDNLRRERLIGIIKGMKVDDPLKARKIIESSNLRVSERDELLKLLK